MKLFHTIAPVDAYFLENINPDEGLNNRRKKQVEKLAFFLEIGGCNYSEAATLKILKDLAEYEQLYDNWRYHRTDINLPMPAVCVYKAYDAMFNAFDKFLIDTIGIHYEVETWDDPLGEVTGSETVFGEQAARDRYNEIVADGYYARLFTVDGEGFPIYVVEANF